jgi:hypothetical protein
VSLQQFDERNPVLTGYSFGSTYVSPNKETLVAATDVPIRVDAITIVNATSQGLNIEFWLALPSLTLYIGTAVAPAYAGQPGVAQVDALAVITPSDQKWLIIPPGASLQALLESNITTAGQHLDITVRGGTL